MFSCVLLHHERPGGTNSTSNDVLVAERVDLDMQIVSNAGRGTVNCQYFADKSYKDVVACVSSTICVKGASTQRVKVTKYRVETKRDGCKPQCVSLHLSKLDKEYPARAKSLPSYASVKKRLGRSISPDDLLLHLGNFEAETTVTIHFDFLVQLKLAPPLSSASSLTYPALYHVIECSIPSKHILYKLRLASNLQITNIAPTNTSAHLIDFNWFHIDRSKRVIRVKYETMDLQELDDNASFCIELAGHHNHSACCTCLVPNEPKLRLGIERRSEEDSYDGVMMLSSQLSRDNLHSTNFCPSEFVFLVDCSASMNPFIDNVVASLITSIKSLPEGCFFNLIAFGSSFLQLFQESQEYSKSSVKSGIDFALKLKASLGGTELLPPLRWIYKKSRKSDMPCQIFIITDVDQEVKDVPYMLSTIKKHRHHARCHTFGIGSNICENLVTSIAETSGGQCVIIQEGDRLQTKMMEVLKESLQPFLMDTEIKWRPPCGYSVVDSTPKSFGTIYSQQTQLAFAFLRRNSNETNGNGSNDDSALSPATIVGKLKGQEVKIPVREAVLPPLTSPQTSELASILGQVGMWSRLDELETLRLMSSLRKNSTETDQDDLEPKAKRPRLNGEISPIVNPSPSASELQEDMLKKSLESGIPCPFTFFEGSGKDGRQITQVLPFSSQTTTGRNKNGIVHQRRVSEKKRRYHRGVESQQQQNHLSSSIASSLAKSTISAVSSSLGRLVSFITPDVNAGLHEEGNTIEDEVERQKRKGTQLYWDERQNEIKYPSMYYQNKSSSSGSGITQRNKHLYRTNFKPLSNGHHQALYHSNNTEMNGLSHSTSSLSESSSQRYAFDTSSSSDDEDDCMTISDSESDSSIDFDWNSLPKTREYLPMIQMQLFSGAWPMVHGFSYAVRVPLGEIWKLPLLNQESGGMEKTSPLRKGNPQDIDDETNAHFWTTALAVVCFRECFPEFESEWELIVQKGEAWIERNLDQCALGMNEVQAIAKELLFRKS